MRTQKNSTKKEKGWVEELKNKFIPLVPGKSSLSLILPAYNCSELIDITLESIATQTLLPDELIVVDAGSTDHTLEIVHSYMPLVTRIYSVQHYDIVDMFNRGISLASKKYVTFMLPGTFYLSPYALQNFVQARHQNGDPDLLYCGSIQRELTRTPRVVFAPFSLSNLEKGQHPANLVACWIRKDLFERLGKLDPRFQMRFSLDFCCRFSKEPSLKAIPLDRVLIDFDYGPFSYEKALRYASETWRIIYIHFGWLKAMKWFFKTARAPLVKSVWKELKNSAQKN